MTVIAEMQTEKMVEEVFKHTKNLAGSRISVEQELDRERLIQKKVMVELKRNILAVSQRHRVSVRNDKLKVGDKSFMWSKNRKLMCGQ